MREYYIRREGDEDSSGPFDLDQISSMIESGQLDATAYFYDIESENWQLISSNQEMMDVLFPKKRKLLLRTEEVERKRREEEAARAAEQERLEEEARAFAESEGGSDAAINEPKPKIKVATEAEAPREKLEVAKMLAMAEGRADDPDGKSPREKKAAIAYFGMKLLTFFFVVSILAMGMLERDLVLSANAIAMAKSPYLLVAAVDLVLVVFLLLQVTEVYPLLRFRAAIGVGMLTLLFYASGDGILLMSNLFLMIAVYACSAVLKKSWLWAGATAGALGTLGYAAALAMN